VSPEVKFLGRRSIRERHAASSTLKYFVDSLLKESQAEAEPALGYWIACFPSRVAVALLLSQAAHF
jgi:hypothetical protein